MSGGVEIKLSSDIFSHSRHPVKVKEVGSMYESRDVQIFLTMP